MITIREMVDGKANLALEAYGTSEGSSKGWDTRGRGRKSPLGKGGRQDKFELKDQGSLANKVDSALRKVGYTQDQSKKNMGNGENYYTHPAGHTAVLKNTFNDQYVRVKTNNTDHLADVEKALDDKQLLGY